MRKFVFWTGVYNVAVGVVFLIPGAPGLFGMPTPQPIGWLYLPLLLVIVIGAIVIIASRDLHNRASFVIWDGIGRVAALFSAVAGSMGLAAIGFGVVDFLIAMVYFTRLPGYVGVSLWDLLTGKPLHLPERAAGLASGG